MEDLIINQGANVHTTADLEGNHILHIAVKSAQGLSIQLLIDNGANMDLTNHKNSTPDCYYFDCSSCKFFKHTYIFNSYNLQLLDENWLSSQI